MFSTCFTSLSVLLLFPLSITFVIFYSISSNIDEVLLIKPSAHVFVFGDFNIHHKDWLTYQGLIQEINLGGSSCPNNFLPTELRAWGGGGDVLIPPNGVCGIWSYFRLRLCLMLMYLQVKICKLLWCLCCASRLCHIARVEKTSVMLVDKL